MQSSAQFCSNYAAFCTILQFLKGLFYVQLNTMHCITFHNIVEENIVQRNKHLLHNILNPVFRYAGLIFYVQYNLLQQPFILFKKDIAELCKKLNIYCTILNRVVVRFPAQSYKNVCANIYGTTCILIKYTYTQLCKNLFISGNA